MNSLQKLGEGGNGIVYCKDNKAVKKMFKDEDIDFISSIREISIMFDIYYHPFVVEFEKCKLNGNMSQNRNKNFEGMLEDPINTFFEKADMDLYVSIHDNRSLFNFKDYVHFMVELMLVIDFLHNHKNIIHGDLKPSNVLVFMNDPHYGKVIKLTDFGLSLQSCSHGCKPPYLFTYLYRAPEICVGSTKYDNKVDIWALGLIFFEMISERTYIDFYPTGKDYNENGEVLSRIIKMCGTLTQSVQSFCDKNKIDPVSENKPISDYIDLKDIELFEKETKCSFELFCNLIENMTKIVPEERYDIRQCLSHPFFASYQKFIKNFQGKIEKETEINRIPRSLVINHCEEREWMKEIIFSIYMKRKKLKWYNSEGYLNHRILFQAINMFDRYFVKLCRKKKKLDKKQISFIVWVIVYMCFKYFSLLGYSYKFHELYGKTLITSDLNKLFEIEKNIIEEFSLDGYIYRDTIYERYSGEMTIKDLEKLLVIYLNNPSISGMTADEIIKAYHDKKIQEIDIKEISSIQFC